MYSDNDYRLYHSWGTSPKQKAREREYNAWYYAHNKDKWKQYAKNAANAVGEATGWNAKKRMERAEHLNNIAERSYHNYSGTRDRYDNVKEYTSYGRPLSDETRAASARSVKNYKITQANYGKATQEYLRTPMGVIGSAVSAGKKAIEKLVDKIRYKEVSSGGSMRKIPGGYEYRYETRREKRW